MINSKKNTFEQHDNESISFYRHSVNKLEITNHLDNKIDVDVCVIGGGLTGVTSALNLTNKGYKVALLEARKIGWGASGRNGGQLSTGMRRDQKFLEKKLGMDHAKELWNLGLESVKETINLISKYNIQCSIHQGVMHAGYYPNDYIHFVNDIEHMQKFYNFNDYEYFDLNQIRNQINSEKYYSGLLNKNAYHLNPLKYLYGITKELLKLKVKIYENSPAERIEETNSGIEVKTKHGFIKTNYVVVGCNGYLDNLLGKTQQKFMPINNYMIATEPLGEKNARELISNNFAVCDTRFIIDYYRFSEDWRMLFGGGETYTSAFLDNSKKIVSSRMYKIFPILKKYKIDFSWGGTLAITVNRLPHFGTLMNNKVIYAHGYSGHGLGLSTLAGKLIAEKISGYNDRFNFIESINHNIIPGGNFLRRLIYASAIGYYKLKDLK